MLAQETETPVSDVFYINRFTITRYLLTAKKPPELAINIDNYLSYLENQKTWDDYRKSIEDEIKLLKEEDASLHGNFPSITDLIPNPDPNIAIKAERRKEIQQKLTNLYQEEKNYEQLDAFLKDHDLHEKILLEEEAVMHQHELEIEKTKEKVLNFSEATFEIHTNIIEVNDKVQEYAQELDKISQKAGSADAASTSAEHLSTGATTLRSIPLIGDFVRGLNLLREAYVAYQDPHTIERNTKIATGVVAGLTTIGAGIVGALLLAGTGLLASTIALFAAPIILGSAILGTYAAVLYRDHRILKQSSIELEHAEKILHNLNRDFAHETENVINNFINETPNQNLSEEVISIQRKELEIKDLVTQLHDAERNQIPESALHSLKDKIHTAHHERNKQIEQSQTLKKELIKKLQNDPRLARISIQKSKLAKSITLLNIAKRSAEKKRFFSAISTIGVGLALTALCLTGIGALVVGGIAATVLIAASVARVYQTRKENKQTQIEIAEHHTRDHAHSSLYDIDYRLLHGKKAEIQGALIQQQEDLQRSPKTRTLTQPIDSPVNKQEKPIAADSSKLSKKP